MRGPIHCLVAAVVAAGLFLAVAYARAETATLELKRVDTSARARSEDASAEPLFRMTRPQTVFQQLGGREGMIRRMEREDVPKFSDVIKKEPAEYAAEMPFRGVVKLGSHHYGFVFDAAPPKEETKEEAKEEPPAEKKEQKREGLFSALGKALTAPLTKKPESQSLSFSRLYFDLNRNGDLTDDDVIEAESAQVYSPSASRATFPMVEIALDVDGKKVDYAFTMSVQVNSSDNFAYAYAMLNAAAYREGEIDLDGQKRRVVLVDFNSNGRFDDAFHIDESVRSGDGPIYPEIGDMLYIDPQPAAGYRSPYDPTTSGDQYYVGKLIAYEGRFFELRVDRSGEELSMTPSSLAAGYAANPNHGVRAIVYGEHGILEIAFGDQGNAMLPEGVWRLLSYTMLHAEADGQEADDSPESSRPMGRPTMVSARAGRDVKAVRIADGKTTKMTFGPPFTPQVDASPSHRGDGTLSLQMSLVGAGGEVCSSMIIDGRRPSQPEFTISTKDGEEVASGKFSYG